MVDIIKKLIQGFHWEKLSHSWHISHLVQEFGEILPSFDYLLTSHVRYEGNRVSDFLANWSCAHLGITIEMKWPPNPLENDLIPLQAILKKDNKDNKQQDVRKNHYPQSGCDPT